MRYTSRVARAETRLRASTGSLWGLLELAGPPFRCCRRRLWEPVRRLTRDDGGVVYQEVDCGA